MTQCWKKLGQLYAPNKRYQHPKLISHAANPLPIHMFGDVYRIFFSGRDKMNKSSVGAVDIDIENRKIINEYYQPFFQHGPEKSFYSDGVSIGNCYECNGVHYILFMGWQNPKNKHWRGDIGRLILKPDFTLELDDDDPFMGPDSTDPVSLSYPWVHKRQNGIFDMWYGSTHTWDTGRGEMLHAIHHASSSDGINWKRNGLAVPYQIGIAQAFSRPTVALAKNGAFNMWFSFRSGSGEKYRIGLATSYDGKNWKLRLKDVGINVSEYGWDSEMIAYPYVFDHKDKRYMLYNGNNYGESGFGLAIYEDSNA